MKKSYKKNEIRNFFEDVKQIKKYRKKRKINQGKLIGNKHEQKQMWKEHFMGLLSKERQTNNINKNEYEKEIKNLI